MAMEVRRNPDVAVVGSTGDRQTRTPQHTFNVQHRPFEIQLVAIVPILAGDSLRAARFEARVLTDPVRSLVTGWWSEFFLFYVRFSNLDEAAALKTMVLSTADAPATTGLLTAANAWTYNVAGSVDYLAMAMKPIIRKYFRKEGDDWNTANTLLGAIPMAAVPGKHWTDTLVAKADLTPTTVVDDYELYEGRWQAYEILRKQKLVTMTFQEYLKAQGVAVPDQLVAESQDENTPELLRFTRQFAYPQNTTNPTDGTIAAAASWVVTERVEKRIFADEPGFLVLVHVARPKVYRANQNGAGISLFRNGRIWHGNVQQDAPQESYVERKTTTGTGPVATTLDYVADTNGVLFLGDQFIRGTAFPSVTLPEGAAFNSHYPATAAVDTLFPGAAKNVTVDGALTLSITGRRTFNAAGR